jgi:hypothetical protein
LQQRFGGTNAMFVAIALATLVSAVVLTFATHVPQAATTHEDRVAA